MRKYLLAVANLFILTQAFTQTQHKISTYLSAQYCNTIHDRTEGNNPWGIGAGLQAFYNNQTKFKPSLELTADGYLEDDKVLRVTIDGKEVNDVSSVINLFAGSAFCFSKQFYISFSAGPSFINGNTYLGIKPSIGYYFSGRQKLGLKLSYINIFNREPNYEETKMENFGSINLALSFKLF